MPAYPPLHDRIPVPLTSRQQGRCLCLNISLDDGETEHTYNVTLDLTYGAVEAIANFNMELGQAVDKTLNIDPLFETDLEGNFQRDVIVELALVDNQWHLDTYVEEDFPDRDFVTTHLNSIEEKTENI